MAPTGTEKDKKRKRDGTNADASSKKRSVEAAKGDIKVVHTSSKQQASPVIASLAGIQLKPLQFEAYAKPNKDAAGKVAAPSSHSILLHTSAHPRLDYTATAPPSQDTDHYLGVFDPASNSLQLIPAFAATVRSTLRSQNNEVQKNAAQQSQYLQKAALGMEFGTKKAKRAIASKTVNAISTEAGTGVESAVMSTVNETSSALPGRTERDEAVLRAKPIPTPDLETDKIEEVYAIDRLMPKAVARDMAVKEWQDKVRANEPIEFTSRFVANRVQNLGKSENITKLKALKYLLLLLEWSAALRPARGGRKVPKREELKEKLPDWPETALDGVRRRFADGGELNKWHFDNLMTHMAAISLYIDDYRTDTFDLREDLRLESKQMVQYFNELGCRIRALTEKEYAEFRISNKAQGAQRKVALLKLPLDFPKVRNPPKRR